ncbi:MAG: DUF6161 domain-containing protein [Polaromonas sp.]|uniref:DUF6161 domain-containing protein n=1 Tax=Polaromonas sp. TaxID=1869339 RepID=UPI002489949E|nr:DUF6161 domain-containing protein [Polaromonas sp.]MDI1269466.1 DUF6161 domain-containing protein [Polaromonas sp.]
MTEDAPTRTAPSEPLFQLDLAENGGLFAPTTLEEARSWIEREQSFWSWIQSGQFGNQDQGVKQSYQLLIQSISNINQAQQYQASNPQEFQHQVQTIERQLRDVFLDRKLPHSSTPLAKRIDNYRQSTDDQAGSFFASVFLPPQQGHHFQPQNLPAWRGLIEGLIDRFNIANAPQKGRKQAADQSFELLRAKTEALLGEKTTTVDALHRDYEKLANDIEAAASEQVIHFSDAQTQRDTDFQKLVTEHKEEMEQLRKTFREEIALRAPAEYWETKRRGHELMGRITGGLSFASIAGAAIGLGFFVHDLLGKTPQGTAPESWKVAMLVLIGLFTVWGVRLLVRMFLSNLHLSTDAAERVVMVRTYLSLLEGNRLSGGEDRQLILQALFRPASDGIVKDEGLPPSMFEFLTRQSKG